MAQEADRLVEEVDTRPGSSFYAGPFVNLYLNDGMFSVPHFLLGQHPKLASPPECERGVNLDTTSEVGHVLVHYLFTGKYQCLKPKGSSQSEKLAAEFTTNVRVYDLARNYDLQQLAELAQGEIERLGNDLGFLTALNLLQTAYPDPSANDAWLSSYLKSGLESLFQNPSELADSHILSGKCKKLSVSDLLVKNLIDLIQQRVVLLRDVDAAIPIDAPQESAFVMPVPEILSPAYTVVDFDELSPSEACEPDLTTETEPELLGLDESVIEEASAAVPEHEAELEHWQKELDAAPKPESETNLLKVQLKELGDAFLQLEQSLKTVALQQKQELEKESANRKDDTLAVATSDIKKEKKKKSKSIVPEPEQELEPEPASAMELELERRKEKEKEEHDFWEFWGSSVKKDKKKKRRSIAPEPEPELNLEAEPEPKLGPGSAMELEPEPEKESEKKENDTWGFATSIVKKEKKKKRPSFVPEPAPGVEVDLELKPKPASAIQPEPKPEKAPETESGKQEDDKIWNYDSSVFKREKRKKKKSKCIAPEPEPVLEPEPAHAPAMEPELKTPPEQKDENDHSHFNVTNEGNTLERNEKPTTANPEPKPEVVLELESELEKKDIKTKKHKNTVSEPLSLLQPVPEAQPVVWPQPETAPNPQTKEEFDFWGLPSKKDMKKKKKKVKAVEADPKHGKEDCAMGSSREEATGLGQGAGPLGEAERSVIHAPLSDNDFSSSWGLRKPDKKEEEAMAVETDPRRGEADHTSGSPREEATGLGQEAESLGEAERSRIQTSLSNNDSGWSFWGFREPDKKEARQLGEAGQNGIQVPLPITTFPRSLGGFKNKGSNPTALCGRRAEHIFGLGWKECHSCRDLVRQLSQQLAMESSRR